MGSKLRASEGLRLNEIFTTVQGEGPNVGKLTQFIRFAGCNLTCPGWGVKTTLPSGKEVVGCDTPHAVFPELYKNDPVLTPEQVIERLRPEDEVPHLCITGGEPLLQPYGPLNTFFEALVDHRDYTVDLFTNGTFLLGRVPFFGQKNVFRSKVTVVMDYKLRGSGESGKFLTENLEYLIATDAVKFVVKDRTDFDEAVDAVNRFYEGSSWIRQTWLPQWMVGPVWGLMDPVELIEWTIKSGINFRLNLQTHKFVDIDEAERSWK